MTKEDHAIQGSPVRFAFFGPTEWLFVHGGILIAWALMLGRRAAREKSAPRGL